MNTNTLLSLLVVLSFVETGVAEEHLLVDVLRMDFLNLDNRLWEYYLWDSPEMKEAELNLVNTFTKFDGRLKKMPEDILRGLDPIKHLHPFLLLYPELRHIENMYDKFRAYQQDYKQLSNEDKRTGAHTVDVEDVVKDILQANSGANASVHRVYDLTFGQENMFFRIFQMLGNNYYCRDSQPQSPQQVFYNLYNVIALNGLKSYIMLQFAYLWSQINKGGFANTSAEVKQHFESRVNETMSVFRGAMEILPKTIWRCDPERHVAGKTYDKLTRLLQGHIQNEVDMNPDRSCRENCAAYPAGKSYGCYDSDSKYCTRMEGCNGNIVGCKFIESHMEACPSSDSSRRYDYVQYASGRVLGRKTNCARQSVHSWWRWFVHCSYCMCICDEQGPKSDRFINLRSVLADIKNNRVVTGVRLIKHNRIVHVQIQEGQLLPYGFVANSTVRWVPVDDYKITDPKVYSGKDYFTMSYRNRSLALDEVCAFQPKYVVTGVRFQFVDNQLRLQIHVNRFDWTNGTVLQSSSNYIYKKATGGQTKIDLSNADIPTRSPASDPLVEDNPYVEFTHSDMEKDAAQTTVPFLDVQPVQSVPAVPLAGLGLYFKSKRGFGGFVAPKIVTYDYSPLVLIKFPTPDKRYDPFDVPQS